MKKQLCHHHFVFLTISSQLFKDRPGPEVIKKNFMLSSAKYEILNAHISIRKFRFFCMCVWRGEGGVGVRNSAF